MRLGARGASGVVRGLLGSSKVREGPDSLTPDGPAVELEEMYHVYIATVLR